MIRPLACAATAVALAAFASADTRCHRADVASTDTSFSRSVTFPKFDPALGVLQRVTFQVSGRADGDARVENTAGAPVVATIHFSADYALRRPDATAILSGSFDEVMTENLAAYDGNTNFAGPSGETNSGLGASFLSNHVSPAPLSDLALFTGTGDIVLVLEVIDTCNVTGGSQIVSKFKQVADAKLELCYEYSKDCNGNGIDDDVDVQNGMPDGNHDGIPDECQPMTKEFCAGDGAASGGIACPCGNDSPSGSGRGCLNGTGVGALLTASGVPSIANDTLVLTVVGLTNGAGYYFEGSLPIAGGGGQPFGNGLRCVGGSVVRIRKIPTSSGSSTFPLPGQPPVHVLTGVTAGETKYYQAWYRDPFGACGLPFNTSNGVIVVWGL